MKLKHIYERYGNGFSVTSHVLIFPPQTRPEYKLPGLYLLDSLVKHVGTPYTVFLGRNLYHTFFHAYTVVDSNTRRAMDELFQSWTKPAPDSRDPRPIFATGVTHAIEAALAKMRGVGTWARADIENDKSYDQTRVPLFAQSPFYFSTPNNAHASQISQKMLSSGAQSMPSLSNQNEAHAYQPSVVPADISSRSPSARRSSTIGLVGAMQSSHSVAGTSVSYVYTGPPPATMSHHARLDKLKYDVEGLLDAVGILLQQLPFDHEKLKLQQNLQSLKHLLETGSLSLTHIQSTEIVVANIAREIPLNLSASHRNETAASEWAERRPVFNSSAIASILAKGAPQVAQTSPQTCYSPASIVPPSQTLPVQTGATTLQASASSHSLLAPSAYMISNVTTSLNPPTLAIQGHSSGLLDQLRASGLLKAVPPAAPLGQPQGATSVLTQLSERSLLCRGQDGTQLDGISLTM
jgi:pre-mRNA cleavage complex 2 protein Pcf11